MYAWGSTIHGELGFGGVEPEHITTPTKLNWILSSCVKEAVLGDNHTLFLMNDSKVYSCGNNDYGQLGHQNPRKRPRRFLFKPVAGLDYHQITSVACGSMHSMALNSWGQVLAWGSDFHGQLGHQNGEHIQPIPKVVQALSTYTIIQIACGSRHSLALANNGDILAWGSNKFGQLGLGCFTDAEVAPKLVVSLTGLPVSFIACGSNHSFCLSKSGAVYGWGKNTKGQLGLSDTDNKKFPTQLRSLRNIRVRYISCGEEFSMFLTIDGGVLTCGGGMYGQLGHGNNKNELLPRQVAELMGSTITQISCGRQHSLALVPSRGHVYSFGIGGCGQLGLNKMINVFTPNVVLGPWVSPGDTSVIASGRKDENLVVHRLFTGGDHCFVSVEKQGRNKSLPEFDHRTYQPETQILDLNQKYAQTLQTIGNDAIIDPKIFTYCEIVFKSLACLNGSFLLPHDKHYFCHSNHHGVDMAVAEDVFNMIGTVENSTINEIIWNGITEHVIPQLCSSPPDVETLRVYLTLPLYHQFNNPKQYLKLQKVYALAALKLHTQASRVLQMWWSSMTCDYFERMVNIFRDVASYIIRSQSIQQGKTVVFDSSLVAMLEMLKIFNRLNSDGIKVPFETFHISEITDLLDIRIDYVYWLCDSSPNKLYLCNYAFVFDTQAKLQLLMTDQSIQKETAMQGEVNQFLILNVSRQNIVEDSLRELSNCIHLGYDLKKPLKIKFIGEEAEDIGGVSKEFFMLLLREILDAKYGMFIEYEESRTIWFADNTFEDKKVYFLIGMICGLAIYNYTIIDIPFPLALYKMLLNEPVNLQDLRGLTPSLADSLQALLEYTDPDFKDVYGSVRFDITRNIWGDVRVYDLIPNGSNIPVTQENKTDFVDLYVKFILTDSVKTQFKGFYDGFMKVCGCRVLKLFHSHELMSVVVGNEDYDWDALEEAAVYKGDYKSSDATIRWFWEVLHEMCFDDKRKFLLFLTGCNRIPIQGMKAIKLIIQPTNDEKYLPVAHTCFNMLDLPRYGTKERLRYKLMQAIQQTEGFSLV